MTTGLPAGAIPEHGPLLTRDGVRLRAGHVAAAPSAVAGRAVVLAHGFGCSLDKPFVARIAHRLAAYAGVVAVDFRGHGRSTGRSTMGDAEVLDLDTAVGAARELGYDEVITLGFSMGGATAIRHAGLIGVRTEHPVDAVIAVSSASRWYRRETRAMRRLQWMAERRAGRRVTRRVLGTRIDDSWLAVPTPPETLIGRIAPVPVLIVHGDRDKYLTVDNATDLYQRADEPRELWLWPGFGHAELAMTPTLTDRIGEHLGALLAGGGGTAPTSRAVPDGSIS